MIGKKFDQDIIDLEGAGLDGVVLDITVRFDDDGHSFCLRDKPVTLVDDLPPLETAPLHTPLFSRVDGRIHIAIDWCGREWVSVKVGHI